MAYNVTLKRSVEADNGVQHVQRCTFRAYRLEMTQRGIRIICNDVDDVDDVMLDEMIVNAKRKRIGYDPTQSNISVQNIEHTTKSKLEDPTLQ